MKEAQWKSFENNLEWLIKEKKCLRQLNAVRPNIEKRLKYLAYTCFVCIIVYFQKIQKINTFQEF